MAGSDSKPRLDDAQMEAVMGRLLQVGVLLAAAVVAAGGAMYLHAHSGGRPNYRSFVAKPITLQHPGVLLRGVLHGDSTATMVLGILLLVATPICRVIFAVVAFALERDRLYVAISATVLTVLLFSLLKSV